MGFEWITSPSETFPAGMQDYANAIDSRVRDVLISTASEAESWMKSNARWTDRSGQARRGLRAEYVRQGDNHTIVFSTNVPHGPALEFTNGGAFSIVRPAIRRFGLSVMSRLSS